VAADVYGVNTRNLDTLSIDRATATETLGRARALGLRPLLGLSGVARPSDAAQFWKEGVDGLLVGSAVARAADPVDFLASLRRPADGDGR
jgi:indole-3-glycerol phosphate synthase